MRRQMHLLRHALVLSLAACTTGACAGVETPGGPQHEWFPASRTPARPAQTPTEPAQTPTEPAEVASEATTSMTQSGPEQQPAPVVSMSITPHHAVVSGRPGALDVMIRLTGEGQVGHRPPLDLAIVVDRSGSMAGDKLMSTQRAAMGVINSLDASDHVSLLTYGSDVILHGRRRATNVMGKEAFRLRVLQVEAGGATALGPALLASLDVLNRAERDRDVLAHVLLLSDGRANQGETDPDVLAASARTAFGGGIGTTTFGVGLDYNEDLLTKLADAGGGRYHFIESADGMAQMLADELAGLTSTVARRVVIQLRPAPGVEIERVFGYETHRDGTSVGVLVGALSARQSRAILVRLRYTGTPGPALGLGEVRLTLIDANAGVPAKVTLWPTVPVVGSAQQVAATTNIEVAVRAAELAASDRLREAARALQASRFDQAHSTLQFALGELQTQNEVSQSPDLDDEIEAVEDALVEVRYARESKSMNRRAQKRLKSRAYTSEKR